MGSGDKFIYFLFSADSTLATGNTLSSDGKAQFGGAQTDKLTHHWKVRIDGASYNEYRVGNGTDWLTDLLRVLVEPDVAVRQTLERLLTVHLRQSQRWVETCQRCAIGIAAKRLLEQSTV